MNIRVICADILQQIRGIHQYKESFYTELDCNCIEIMFDLQNVHNNFYLYIKDGAFCWRSLSVHVAQFVCQFYVIDGIEGINMIS